MFSATIEELWPLVLISVLHIQRARLLMCQRLVNVL